MGYSTDVFYVKYKHCTFAVEMTRGSTGGSTRDDSHTAPCSQDLFIGAHVAPFLWVEPFKCIRQEKEKELRLDFPMYSFALSPRGFTNQTKTSLTSAVASEPPRAPRGLGDPDGQAKQHNST